MIETTGIHTQILPIDFFCRTNIGIGIYIYIEREREKERDMCVYDPKIGQLDLLHGAGILTCIWVIIGINVGTQFHVMGHLRDLPRYITV